MHYLSLIITKIQYKLKMRKCGTRVCVLFWKVAICWNTVYLKHESAVFYLLQSLPCLPAATFKLITCKCVRACLCVWPRCAFVYACVYACVCARFLLGSFMLTLGCAVGDKSSSSNPVIRFFWSGMESGLCGVYNTTHEYCTLHLLLQILCCCRINGDPVESQRFLTANL